MAFTEYEKRHAHDDETGAIDDATLRSKATACVADMNAVLLDFFVFRKRASKRIDATIACIGAPVTHDTCAAAAEKIREAITACGDDSGTYAIAVSSPGLSRRLRSDSEFTVFSGAPLSAHLTPEGAAVHGTQRIRGVNAGFADGVLHLTVNGSTIAVKKEHLHSVCLDYEL